MNTHLICLILLILATPASLHAAGAKTGAKMVQYDLATISKMSNEEIPAFAQAMKSRLAKIDDPRTEVVQAFRILSRRSDLTKPAAAALLKALQATPLPKTNFATYPLRAAEEKATLIFLRAKAGILAAADIEAELKTLSDKTTPSTVRLAQAAALADATEAIDFRPTYAQLATLLANDVYEIRMLAVDWYRVAPPRDSDERHLFLKLALASNPNGVRERAYRTIASWTSPEIADAVKASQISFKECEKEQSAKVRLACVEARRKSGAP